MRIESLSIKAATIAIFIMIGGVAAILSFLAGNYFRQAALDAQMNSLSRVIEVASQEILREMRGYAFELGMKLGNSGELVRAMGHVDDPDGMARIGTFLDDPFISGFTATASIDLEKIRIYDPELNLIAASSRGLAGLDSRLVGHLAEVVVQRSGVDRLKAIDALWMSAYGPLHSTLVPVGGLRLAGYLEIVISPAFNLPDIGKITNTPVSILSMEGSPVAGRQHEIESGFLPIEYIMSTSDGQPAFRIVGYEDVARLNEEMEATQWVTIAGFMLLTISTLLFALWLFNRFMFVPVNQLMVDMKRMARGELARTVNKHGLRDFSMLAETFNAMAREVRLRTGDLERLLDADDSAILCFGGDQELVYSNIGAARLFGYSRDEMTGMDFGELFSEDIRSLADCAERPGKCKFHAQLRCIGKDGQSFPVSAILSTQDVHGGHGHAIVLNSMPNEPGSSFTEGIAASSSDAQRIDTVEESLNSLLDIARNSPGLMAGSTRMDRLGQERAVVAPEKAALCAQVVRVMHAALACWEHDLGKSKLDLAEASRIWPVYIDKSTPTTRTLDRYLNIESCPRNPRTQRVVDTAEFVLKQAHDRKTPAREKLQQALNELRLLIAGMRSA